MKSKKIGLSKKDDIVRAIEKMRKSIFTHSDFRQIFAENRSNWQLGSLTLKQFAALLENETDLRKVKIDFPHRPAFRYVWGNVSTFELLQSLNEEAYFSHYTAMQLHELTEQIPKTIYLNIEQPRRSGGGILTQSSIDRAFQSKCRVSKNTVVYQGRTICLINGANTGKLGVIDVRIPDASSTSKIRATNIERTLIDATVRPIYAGGVFEVAKAFESARDHVSANKLSAYLRKLNYTYPYHQAIGFYMQRAGYTPSQLDLMRRFDINYDFYLDYGLKETDFNEEWRLHVPKGF